jgi:hypothetical protein
MCRPSIKFQGKGWDTNGISYRIEAPFDKMESAQEFVKLLIEESKSIKSWKRVFRMKM